MKAIFLIFVFIWLPLAITAQICNKYVYLKRGGTNWDLDGWILFLKNLIFAPLSCIYYFIEATTMQWR